MREREWDNGGPRRRPHNSRLRHQLRHQPRTGTSRGTGHYRFTAEIQKLADLHDSGALTDEEFTAMKKKLLGL